MQSKRSQSGSVLFYILIGIALFAALGFAMSKMMQGESGPPAEMKTTTATAILEYADTVRNAVRAMQVDGVDANKICFDNPGWGNGSYTFAACATPANSVFDPNGGGVIWEKNSGDINNASSWLFTGANGIKDVGTTCANASCADLKMVLPGLTKDVCIALNNQLGITNPGGDPPADTGYDATPFAGTYSISGTNDIGDEAGSAALAGQSAGCFKAVTAPAANSYTF